ncbi:hypothetical protein QYF36_022177 [Acer negundo]|nr:hypothetical protein QYF36_022177 [Acer negundo]
MKHIRSVRFYSKPKPIPIPSHLNSFNNYHDLRNLSKSRSNMAVYVTPIDHMASYPDLSHPHPTLTQCVTTHECVVEWEEIRLLSTSVLDCSATVTLGHGTFFGPYGCYFYRYSYCPSCRVVQGKAPLYLLLPNGTLFPLLSRVFGYTYFVQNRSPTRTKLDDKVIRCVFLGYSSMSKGYRCYDLVSRQFYHSLDVTFLEIVPFFSSTSTLSGPAVETSMEDSSMLSRPVPIFELYLLSFTSSRSLPLTIQDYSQHPYAQDPLPVSSLDSGILHPPLVYDVPPHYPTRDRCPLSRYLLSSITTLPIAKYISYQGIQDHYQSFLGQVDSVSIPRFVHEALETNILCVCLKKK